MRGVRGREVEPHVMRQDETSNSVSRSNSHFGLSKPIDESDTIGRIGIAW